MLEKEVCSTKKTYVCMITSSLMMMSRKGEAKREAIKKLLPNLSIIKCRLRRSVSEKIRSFNVNLIIDMGKKREEKEENFESSHVE